MNTHVRDNLRATEYAVYTEFTSAVNVTSTNEAAPDTIVTAGAFTARAEPLDLIFYCPFAQTDNTAGATITLNLWEDGVDLGRIARIKESSSANPGSNTAPVYVRRRHTPTAASHTYSIRAWVSVATGVVTAGAGGAGVAMPGYIAAQYVPD